MKLTFTAKIDIIGVNPFVYLPQDVLNAIFAQSGKNKGTIPVKGTINGKTFIQTLVKYQGEWRLYINGIMRKATGTDVGDKIDIAIMYDHVSREVPMHPLLKKALEKNKKAKNTFAAYPPSHQKEINRYLNTIKTEAILLKHIDRIIKHLSGQKVGYSVILRNR